METRSKRNTKKPRIPWSPAPNNPRDLTSNKSRTLTSHTKDSNSTLKIHRRPGPARKTGRAPIPPKGASNSSSSSSDSDESIPPPLPPKPRKRKSDHTNEKEKTQETLPTSESLMNQFMTKIRKKEPQQNISPPSPISTQMPESTPPPNLSPQKGGWLITAKTDKSKFIYRGRDHPPVLTPNLPEDTGKKDRVVMLDEITGMEYELIDLSDSCDEEEIEIIETQQSISGQNPPTSTSVPITDTTGQVPPTDPNDAGGNTDTTDNTENNGLDLTMPKPVIDGPVQFGQSQSNSAFTPVQKPTPVLGTGDSQQNIRGGRNENSNEIGETPVVDATTRNTGQQTNDYDDVPIPPEIEEIYLPIFKTLSRAGRLMVGVDDITGSAIPQLGKLLKTVAKGQSKLWMPPSTGPTRQTENRNGTGTGSNGVYENSNVYVDENGDRWFRQH